MATEAPQKARSDVEETGAQGEPSGTRVELSTGAVVWLGGRLKMRDLRQWAAAEKAGDLDTCYKFILKVVTGTTLPLDLSDPLCWDDLDIAVYRELNREITAWLQETERGAK